MAAQLSRRGRSGALALRFQELGAVGGKGGEFFFFDVQPGKNLIHEAPQIQ